MTNSINLAAAIKSAEPKIFSFVASVLDVYKPDKNSLDKYDVVMVLNKQTNAIDVNVMQFVQCTIEESIQEMSKKEAMTEEERAEFEKHEETSPDGSKWSPHIASIPVKLAFESFPLEDCNVGTSILYRALDQVVLEKPDPDNHILNRYFKRYAIENDKVIEDLNINVKAGNIAALHQLNIFAGLKTRTGLGIFTTVKIAETPSIAAAEHLVKELFVLLDNHDKNLILDISLWSSVKTW